MVVREKQGQRRNLLKQDEAKVQLAASGNLLGVKLQGLRCRLALGGVDAQADGVAKHLQVQRRPLHISAFAAAEKTGDECAARALTERGPLSFGALIAIDETFTSWRNLRMTSSSAPRGA